MYELERVCFSRSFRWSKRVFVAALKTDDVIQGVYDNKIAGYVLSTIEAGTGHITSLVIDPKYRKQGFGKSLMDAIEAFYKKKGIKKIKLEVHVDNPAQTLYFKLGYRVTGFRPRYYHNGSNAITMVKVI